MKYIEIKSIFFLFVVLLLLYIFISNFSCFICRRLGLKLIVVLIVEKNLVFLRKKVFIFYGSRWCVKFLLESKFIIEVFERFFVYFDIININRILNIEIILYLWEIVLENEWIGIDFVNKINFYDSIILFLLDLLKFF